MARPESRRPMSPTRWSPPSAPRRWAGCPRRPAPGSYRRRLSVSATSISAPPRPGSWPRAGPRQHRIRLEVAPRIASPAPHVSTPSERTISRRQESRPIAHALLGDGAPPYAPYPRSSGSTSIGMLALNVVIGVLSLYLIDTFGVTERKLGYCLPDLQRRRSRAAHRAVGWINDRIGEVRTLRLGCVLLMIGLLLMPLPRRCCRHRPLPAVHCLSHPPACRDGAALSGLHVAREPARRAPGVRSHDGGATDVPRDHEYHRSDRRDRGVRRPGPRGAVSDGVRRLWRTPASLRPASDGSSRSRLSPETPLRQRGRGNNSALTVTVTVLALMARAAHAGLSSTPSEG